MADQIEMSSAENTPRNYFIKTSNVFGTPLTMKSTFSFGCTDHCTVLNKSWTPFNLGMGKYTERVKSFLYWPKQLTQKPEQLISSGFYYTGRGDRVTCFFCGLTLTGWETTDNVHSEHKKHSSECKFLLMCRDI